MSKYREVSRRSLLITDIARVTAMFQARKAAKKVEILAKAGDFGFGIEKESRILVQSIDRCLKLNMKMLEEMEEQK